MEFSDFFSEKIKACENFNNETKFDYTMYNHSTIKLFLDIVHGYHNFTDDDLYGWHKLDHIETENYLELMGFLAFEGKKGKIRV